MPELVLSKKNENVLILTLNRQEKGNSLTPELLQQLVSHLDVAYSDPSLHALCLTGAGRFFCTGADLNELGKANETRLREMFDSFSQAIEKLMAAPFLTASLINGDCVGGGLGLALSTDYVLAADDSRLGTPEIAKGLFPFVIAKPLLQKIGSHRTMALFFGGKLISAAGALSLGVISELISRNQFSTRCEELISHWNKADSLLIRRGKETIQKEHSPELLRQYLFDAIKGIKDTSLLG
ncbi:MAG: enoyl-CoA hydratase/isomerase family protein [Deltaproteobacteria bacterium]|nr:enoyl-CoA hydratase/isomerase family protein [Deltaproteobacteria bacterium]